MRWSKGDRWKVGIALAGLLLFLTFIVWLPVSAAAYEGTSGLAAPGTVQSTPTVDATVAGLQKEQLTLQVRQLQNQLQDQNNWFANNSTALIAAMATVIVALFGILQWAITVRQAQRRDLMDRDNERRKEVAVQDKELRAQAEERFKTAVTALGDENEATQVGGAILLRSFLNKEDEVIYRRYYTQIFDLAVAYLRPSNASRPSEGSNTPLPLTPFRQALIVVFIEVFPLARLQKSLIEVPSTSGSIGRNIATSLDASHIQLDNAFLWRVDLEQIWMPGASLQGAHLGGAKLKRATLRAAKLNGATLIGTQLTEAALFEADLREATLKEANLYRASLSRTDLREADLSRTNIEDVLSLRDADLRGVKGLSEEQLLNCKARGAIVDEDTLASSPKSSVSPSPPPQQSS